MQNQNATTQNTLKKELLSINPHTFQFLHHFQGFDGQSPYFIFKMEGRFTHKQIMKQIPAEMGDDFIASLFLIRNFLFSNSKERLHHVMVTETGLHIPHDTAHYKNGIDYFYAKSQLEDVRKNDTKCIYVVVQKREYVKQRGARRKFPENMRYTVAPYGITRASRSGGDTYISQITLIPKTGDGEQIHYKPHCVIYAREKLSNDIHDYVDKSGYLIQPQKEELQRRARILKAERERNAVLNTDFTERKNAIFAQLAKIREMLSHSALNATTYKQAYDLETQTRRYMWVMSDAERLEKADFRNIEQAEKTYSNIESKISEILTEEETN